MIWILAVSVCGAALSASAENTQRGAALSSAQETQAALSDAETDASAELELFLPESYEQYLELENPSDFAISENYIAVADRMSSGNSCIYLLSRTEEQARYYRYEHSSNNVLSSLNFYEADGTIYLFFLETGGTLFYLDCAAPEEGSATIEQISPYSIIFAGNDVYYASATDASANIFHTTISLSDGQITLAPATQLNTDPYDTSRPVFSSYDDAVYLAAGKEVYSCSATGEPRLRCTVEFSIHNFSITGPSIYDIIYVSTDYHLYRGNSEIMVEPTDLSYTGVRLDESTNLAYILTDNGRIMRYDLSAGAFDDYEIAHYSDSDNRIGDADDISAYEGKVVIADTGNERIVIYDNGIIQTPKDILATKVCAGEENFLAITATAVLLCSYGDGEPVSVANISARSVAAAAYSCGSYYLIAADGSATYEVDASTGDITRTGETSSRTSVTDIAADLFGNIYVLASGYVNKYTADQFFTKQEPETVAQFDLGTRDIIVDCMGNLYGLTDNSVSIGSSDRKASLDFSAIAYSNDKKLALSFTFDLESGDMYILSDGFIAKADLGADAPASLSNIAADGLYDSLHGAPAADDAASMLVSVLAGSIILPVADAEDGITESVSVFPYTSYVRTEETRVGVRICTLDAGTLVAFYQYTPSEQAGTPPEREYTLALVLDDKRSTEDDLTVLTDRYTAVTQYTGYITNDVGLYRLPLLRAGNATVFSNGIEDRLEKSTRVTVVGIISAAADEDSPYGLDFDYYFVEAVVGGETVYGFIPTSYVLSYDASADWSDSEDFTFRHVKRGETITLSRTEGDNTFTLDLSDEEQVKVYGEPDENNEVYVTYTDEYGIVWSGRVNADLLYEAGPSTLVILAVVAVVVAAVLVSTCYLILRKQPMMQ